MLYYLVGKGVVVICIPVNNAPDTETRVNGVGSCGGQQLKPNAKNEQAPADRVFKIMFGSERRPIS
jgi:hypothetical protein